MWKEFYKEGQAFTFEVNSMYNGIKDREEKLISEGYLPIFDKRLLSFISNRGGTAILENDNLPPADLKTLQNEIAVNSFKKSIHKTYCKLNTLQADELKKLISDREIKNILIDSLFQDLEQFRYLIKNVFSFFTDINFFINSHGTLIKTLQSELDTNMDKYAIRNPYYTHGGNNKPYFNDLVFTLMKNNIYEVDGDLMKRIKVNSGYEKCEVSYKGTFKWMKERYKTDDTDIEPIERKSQWAEIK